MVLIKAVWGAVALVTGLVTLVFVILAGACAITSFGVSFMDAQKSRKDNDKNV